MTNSRRIHRIIIPWPLIVLALMAAMAAVPRDGLCAPDPGAPVGARTTDAPQPPAHLQGVGVTERVGAAVPLDLEFFDESGRKVRLGDFFGAAVPVIVTLNYSRCPMLCSLQLNGLVEGLRRMDLRLAESYRVITVSLDPSESPSSARQTRARYLARYGDEGAAEGWRFLTGSATNIRTLADALGIGYRYAPEEDQYYHAAALALASPQGTLTRYLYGIEYAPRTLELALMEASQGEIGSTVDRLILYCSAYDPKKGGYGMAAGRIMKIGGGLTAGIIGGALLLLWRRESKRQRETHQTA